MNVWKWESDIFDRKIHTIDMLLLFVLLQPIQKICLKIAKIDNCQNWKLLELKVAKIESTQNWKLLNLKVEKMKVAKIAKVESC